MSPVEDFKDWSRYFKNEAGKPEYGTLAKFDQPPSAYVNDTEEFKKQLASNALETLLLVPGPDKTVRLLHNFSIDHEKTKVSGIYGLKRFSPMKQIAVSSLVKPFVIPAQTQTRTGTKANTLSIPTVDDFKECTSGAELIELVGSSGRDIHELEKLPVSFWLHPQLIETSVTQRQTKIEGIGESYAVAIEGMGDEAATLLTEQLYGLLVYVWAVANGYAHTTVKFLDPPDDDDTDEALAKAQRKLTAVAAPIGQTDRRDETHGDQGNRRNDERSNSRGRSRSESPRRQSRKSDDRRKGQDSRNTERRSRSRSRSPSRGRERSRSRSREDRNRRTPRRDSSRSPTRRRGGSRERSSSRGRDDRRRNTRDLSSDREPDDREFLRQLTRSVSTLAQAQNDSLRKDRVERSVLGKLSERQKDLFTLLAAKDWYDTRPALNRATERLLSSRVPEKQWNLIEDWSRKWPGLVSKQGVVQFLSSGYASKTLPGGFTVFMFSPLKHRKPVDKKDRIRNIKGTFGKEGALDDEAIDFYATLDYFVPESLNDAETQLEMAIHLLEALTHRQGIAIDGYVRGLDIIAKHRLQMYEEIAKDRMFMARFLHFLDLVFNRFCDDLAEYHTRDRQKLPRSSLPRMKSA
jgi:hypothetical protein